MEQNWNLPDKPKRPRRRFWLKLVAGLLFAVVAYGAAYAATVNSFLVTLYRQTGEPFTMPAPGYKVPGGFIAQRHLEKIFLPAHRVDVFLIRREYWREYRKQLEP